MSMIGRLVRQRSSSLVPRDASLFSCGALSSDIRIFRSTSASAILPWDKLPRSLSGKPDISGSDLHSLYLEQMNEINADMEAIFGPSDPALESVDLSQVAKAHADEKQTQMERNSETAVSPWNAEEAYAERESLFQFTSEEKSAWANYSLKPNSTTNQHMVLIKEALAERERIEHSKSTESSSQFTHLNPHQDSISMVDVGNKTSTRRIAKARSMVIFPPEVMSAFEVKDRDMIGPKGPIFETARLAGIMGAKKTSDLIPLCHPLPLDRVHLDIQLVDNKAIIECECRVTHKTGVEMEALTGASIAALTIYDMVKAVSHRVEIGQTVLVSKSGGKSEFIQN